MLYDILIAVSVECLPDVLDLTMSLPSSGRRGTAPDSKVHLNVLAQLEDWMLYVLLWNQLERQLPHASCDWFGAANLVDLL